MDFHPGVNRAWQCYNSNLKVLKQEKNLILDNTKELDKVSKYNLSILYTLGS